MKSFFGNPKAIKVISIIFFFLISIGGIITCFIISDNGSDEILILIPAAPIVGYISSILLYGYGEIIERVQSIDEKLTYSAPQQANFYAPQYTNDPQQTNFNAPQYTNDPQQANFNAPQYSAAPQQVNFSAPQYSASEQHMKVE